MANVFISHRSSDLAEAESLANEIRNAGHRVWLDVWEIRPGDSIVERIQAGLEGASYLIVCFSSSADSPWMSREWMSALARQLNGHSVKVLPVLLAGGSPPALLADIKYADLVKNRAQGIAELLSAIR